MVYRQSLPDAAGKAAGDEAGNTAQGAPIDPQAVKELGPLTLDKGTLGIVNRMLEAEGVPTLDSGDAAIASDAQASLEEMNGNGIMEAEGDEKEGGIGEDVEEFKQEARIRQAFGPINGLTQAEKDVVNDLIAKGKDVEVIPKDPKAIERTPDFLVDDVKTELKTLRNANTNTGMKRIQDGFRQGAAVVIIDARGSGLTNSQALEIIDRARGKYPNGQIPGGVEIWIDGQVITYP